MNARTHNSLATALTLVAVAGCSEQSSSRAQTDMQRPQMTQAQSECFWKVAEAQNRLAGDFASRSIQAMTAKQSTIPITIEQRRKTEELCLKQLECFGVDDFMGSTLFNMCIRQAEKESDG